MDRYQEVIDRTRIVKRTIIPVMSDDPIPGRRRRYGLTPADMELVVQGRACPECLSVWESPVLLKCPLCQHERTPQDILDSAADWEQYRRHTEQQLANPVRTEMRPMNELVDEHVGEVLGGFQPGVKRNL